MSKTRQWATLTAVVCLAVLAAGWFLVIKPQRAHAASLRSQAQTVQGKNAELRSQISQLRQQQRGLPEQQKQLAAIATKIPDNPALPALIRQLSSAADGAGVTLVSLAPGQPTIAQTAPTGPVTSGGASTSGGSTSSASAQPAAAPLATIPLTVQVQGSYFNVEQFFSAVESLSRAMLVSGFTLAPAQTGGSSTGSSGAGGADALPPGTLNAQITAQVFESPSVTTTSTTGH